VARAATRVKRGGAVAATTTARSVRYPTLDVLRGLALISMVTAHVSLLGHPSLSDRLVHEVPWIDGAFYFVAVSGVASGLVHRRIVEKQGFEASARKLVRRAGFIYLVQIGLVAATITLATIDSTTTLELTPTWSELGGVLRGLVDTALLRVEPNFTGVLPMYVAFLLWAIPMVWLLKRGLWWAVAASSIGVYAFGKAVDGFTFAAPGTSFDVLGWQLLFTGGLLLGWAWEHERLAIPALWRKRIVAAAIGFTVAVLCLAVASKGRADDVLDWTVTKFNGGFVAFMFAASALVTAYVVLDALRRRYDLAARLMKPLEILGLKGLPGYAAMVLIVLVMNAFPGVPRKDLTVVLVVVLCGLAEYGSWKFDAWRRQRHRAAAVASPTPPSVSLPGPSIVPAALADPSVVPPG
jgi:hypothetical protein